MKSKQVIVSGATGFVGQHLIPLLLDSGYEVIAIARDIKKASLFDWFDKVQFICLDYHKDEIGFIPEAGSSLIHLAWQGLPNYTSLYHFEENLPKNYTFIKQLISLGVTNVMVVGTCYEYGLQNGPLHSAARTEPANPYALAKDCLRQYLVYLQEQHPFILQWTRLFYLYGAGQNQNSIIAQLDLAIERGDPVFYMSEGEQLRDYLPIETAVMQMMDVFLSNHNGLFNICSGKPISIRRLVENRIKEKGSSITIKLGHYPYRNHEPMAFWGGD